MRLPNRRGPAASQCGACTQPTGCSRRPSRTAITTSRIGVIESGTRVCPGLEPCVAKRRTGGPTVGLFAGPDRGYLTGAMNTTAKAGSLWVLAVSAGVAVTAPSCGDGDPTDVGGGGTSGTGNT